MGARSFFVCAQGKPDGRPLATDFDCHLGRYRNAGALCPAGVRAGPRRRNLSLRDPADQLARVLPARADWQIHAQPPGYSGGLARGDGWGFFRRLHNLFQLWLGTAKMLEDGEWMRAASYVAASVLAGILL